MWITFAEGCVGCRRTHNNENVFKIMKEGRIPTIMNAMTGKGTCNNEGYERLPIVIDAVK